jgi:multidrug transporter EmrE-like cation transporter
MTPRGLWLVILSSLCTVVANLMMREGILRNGSFMLSLQTLRSQIFSLTRQPLFVLGVVFYGLAALIWFDVLSRENLSASYPLLVSLTFVLVTVGAIVFFHEQISWQKVVGLGIILLGIVLVARA